MQTVPSLFAGIVPVGGHRCYYCGALCGEDFPSSTYVKDSFTGRDGVFGGPWVCGGCVQCLVEAMDVPLIDGTIRYVNKCAVRSWSWVVERGRKRAASKAHLDHLRNACLHPPAPPFAIVLSDSGQKHLLYRGVVCWSRETVTVTLEGDRITYRPAELAERLVLVKQLVAATGKPALGEPVTVNFAARVCEYFVDGESLLDQWQAVRSQPLSALAGWLSPNKEACNAEYPAVVRCDGVPPKAGRAGGPDKEADRGSSRGKSQAGGQGLLFGDG